MAKKRKHENHPERLAKGASKAQAAARSGRARKGALRAKPARNTDVERAHGTLVNFIYKVTGLKDFATELRKARKLKFHGLTVTVMPLELIRKSKAAVMRPKDPAHIPYIEETLRLLRAKNRAVKRQ